MTWLNSLFEGMPNLYMPNISITDLLEIFILIFTTYKVIDGIKNTRVMIILKGIGILSLTYIISYLLNFNAILSIFEAIITLAIFAIIVVFQPELRKFLESIGTQKVPIKGKINAIFKNNSLFKQRYSNKTIEEISDACVALSQTKTGALIVIEKDVPLNEYSDTGIYLNADVTKELLINIFEKNTPLHDGAVIMLGNKVVSATAYLPLSENKKINKHMGTRHRAAIGISEVTDCQVVVVSEENGNISYIKNGEIKYGITKETLMNLLKKEQNIKNDKVKKMNFTQRCKHNIGLKIFSILFACIAWLFLINSTDPIVSKTIDNVPISVVNEDVVISTGKVYEIIDNKDISVIISGKRSVVDKVNKEDITVEADLSKLSYVYAVPLTAYCKTYEDLNCIIDNNEILTIKLSDSTNKEFPVQIEEVGENSKFYIGDYTFNYDQIIVSGAKQQIDIIGSVKLLLDTRDITKDGSINITPTIYDKNGSVIHNKMLTTNVPEIKVNYNIYPKKLVPINVTTKGVPIKEIQKDVEKIYIAGTSQTIDNIDEININLDLRDLVTNQSSELSKTISIEDYLPNNTYLADKNKEVVVTLLFDEIYERTLNFHQSDIVTKNLSDKYGVIFEDTEKNIKISGDKEIVDKITILDLAPYLDLKNLGLGDYNLILQYNNINGIKITESPLIKIKIIER